MSSMKAVRGAAGYLGMIAAAALSLPAIQAHAQAAQFLPRLLDFGEVQVGGASPSESIVLRNRSAAPMFISGIEPAGGNFDLAHDCPLAGDPLAPGGNCTIRVRFAPDSEGPQLGAISVTGDAAMGVQVVPLLGSGVALAPKMLPSELIVGFPDTVIYTTSGPMQVVFTNNTGDYVYPYYVSYYTQGSELSDFTSYPMSTAFFAAGPGPVAAKNAAPTGGPMHPCSDYVYPYYYNYGELAPGESCYAPVYFTPHELGQRIGRLTLGYYDSSESYLESPVTLAGVGVPEGFWDISLSPAAVDFGGVVVDTTSGRTIVVTSAGTGPLSVYGVRTVGGAFAATSDCGATVAPGATCNVTVTCSPTALGTITGDLYIDHNGPDGFSNVHLTCKGSDLPVPKIEVTTIGLGFGNQSLGSTSALQPVVIKSVGTAPLAVTTVAAGLPFGATSNCPPALSPGLTCTAQVGFTPTSAGRHRSLLSIGSNDPDRPEVNVDLSGTGCRPFSVQAARRSANLCGP